MNIVDFQQIRCIECLTSLRNPKVGDTFLTGNQMINQKDNKGLGHEVSWYEVTRVSKTGVISYKPCYGRLTKPTED